jgi:hypothetical protein
VKREHIRLGMIFIILASILSFSSAYYLNDFRILNPFNVLASYKLELLFSFLFGLFIALPNFLASYFKIGDLFIDLNRFSIFVIPSTLLILVVFLLPDGSLFFNKTISYCLMLSLGYGILSSIKRI